MTCEKSDTGGEEGPQSRNLLCLAICTAPAVWPACLLLTVLIAGSRTEGSEASQRLTAPLTTRRSSEQEGVDQEAGTICSSAS